MAKQFEQYTPTEKESAAMRVCWKNDLAYVIQPIKGSNKYTVVKFKISDNLQVFTFKENNIDVQFNQYDASKKVMELYSLHAKRFEK